MPYDPNRRAFVLRTYADYLDASYSVSAYCYDLACQHRAALDLRALANRCGMDAEVDWRRLRCTRCGGRNVQVRVSYEIKREQKWSTRP
jgi:hypothetical protein